MWNKKAWGNLKNKFANVSNGFISEYAFEINEFNVIYKLGDKFFKEKMKLRHIKSLRSLNGFKYANIYDPITRIQIASMTKKSSRWFVRVKKDSLILP